MQARHDQIALVWAEFGDDLAPGLEAAVGLWPGIRFRQHAPALVENDVAIARQRIAPEMLDGVDHGHACQAGRIGQAHDVAENAPGVFGQVAARVQDAGLHFIGEQRGVLRVD